MPELPEVESVRRQLAGVLPGHRILRVWRDPTPRGRLGDPTPAEGRRIAAVDRRGKFLLLPLDSGDVLLFHLGMTGGLSFDRPADHLRAAFDLDDGRTLWFRDPRRFGRATVLPRGDPSAIPSLARMGPEPLSAQFDPDRFAAVLARRRAPVKALLLDQTVVAGVGNIYADEALWRARIHPASRRVGRARAHRLHAALRAVLEEAIAREGTSFRDYRMTDGSRGRFAAALAAYGKAGQPCRRCGATLRRTIIAGRGTTYCPGCQRP